MSRSRFTNVAVFAILILEFCGNGCTNLHQVSGIEACLDKVWDLINSTSDSHRPISVVGLDRQMICEIEGFASSGSRLSRIYRLAGSYIFDVREKDLTCVKRMAAPVILTSKEETMNAGCLGILRSLLISI